MRLCATRKLLLFEDTAPAARSACLTCSRSAESRPREHQGTTCASHLGQSSRCLPDKGCRCFHLHDKWKGGRFCRLLEDRCRRLLEGMIWQQGGSCTHGWNEQQSKTVLANFKLNMKKQVEYEKQQTVKLLSNNQTNRYCTHTDQQSCQICILHKRPIWHKCWYLPSNTHAGGKGGGAV